MLGGHYGGRRKHDDRAALGPHGHLVVALRAKVVRLFEPAGQARDASQANAEQAAEHTGDAALGESQRLSPNK
jgi:hypothetical protein